MRERIPLVDDETQSSVARAVHDRTRLIDCVEEQSRLLRERRAALISAAVTGKIDVRGLVADDPHTPAAAPILETVDA